MKKLIILLLTTISCTQFALQAATDRPAIFRLNVVNDSDGGVEILPESVAMNAFKSISTENPFSEIIMDQIKQFTQDKLQAAIETASQINFASGTSDGYLTLDFCPLTLKVKKLSGVSTGKEILIKVPSCKTTVMVISKIGNDFNVTLQ